MGSPILGFRFRVDFGIDGFFITDNGFSKISGITMSLNEEIKSVGSSATNKVNVIKSIDYGDLVMERASSNSSELINWIVDSLSL